MEEDDGEEGGEGAGTAGAASLLAVVPTARAQMVEVTEVEVAAHGSVLEVRRVGWELGRVWVWARGHAACSWGGKGGGSKFQGPRAEQGCLACLWAEAPR